MDYEEEHIKRLKNKLWLYGSYTREFEAVQREYFDMMEIMKLHQDDSKQAAKQCGIRKIDNRHPVEEQLIIKKLSLFKDMEVLIEERSYLGINDFIENLLSDEWQIIDRIFISGDNYEAVGQQHYITKSTVFRHLKKILTKGASLSI